MKWSTWHLYIWLQVHGTCLYYTILNSPHGIVNCSFKYSAADFPFLFVSKMFPKSSFIDVPPPRALIRQCWKGENVALHQLHHGDQRHDPHSFVPVFPDGGAGERLSTFQMPAKNCKKGGWCSLLKHLLTKSQAVNPVLREVSFWWWCHSTFEWF